MLDWIKIYAVTCACVIPAYLLIRRPWRFGKENRGRELALSAFVIYFAGLLSVTLHGEYGLSPLEMLKGGIERLKTQYAINFIPFKMTVLFFRNFELDTFMVNIISNVLVFVPFGFFLPFLWKKNQRFLRTFLFCFLLTLSIETVQLFIGRTVDIDDIILNFIGGASGALLFKLLNSKTEWAGKFSV